MKIFITGIAGFIGYHLARDLQALGHDVSGMDDYNDYYDPELKADRTNILNQRQIRVDVQDVKYIGLIKNAHSADLIVHLAAYAGVRYSLDNPQLYIDNNVIATAEVIKLAEESDTPVVYASSSSVYGGQNFTEDAPFQHLSNPYAWSKYVNECQFKHSKLTSSTGFRFFTVYGPYGRPDMALYTFVDNIMNGKPITVNNHGDMTRDFTYVQDIINGILLLIDETIVNNVHDIYNIGSGKSTQLLRFIELIEDNLGIKAEKIMAPMHPADVQNTLADITKIKTLGYKPKTTVEAGISEFVSWYKSYY
jgi:UDP-glucuronate 4-epimerase|tara:strand:+ start:4389 stop:5309 length:921 start_codon:yes stop_codon:yes gene_type:complete